MSENIINCPFCGGAAQTWEAYDAGWWQAGCMNEDCYMECYTPSQPSEQEAIDMWNKRAK